MNTTWKKESHFAWTAAVAAVVLVGAVMFVTTTRTVDAATTPIVVIVNGANPVDNLSMGELKKIFLSDKSRWDTGKAVAPVMVGPGQPERVAFLKAVCGMSDADFSKYFMQAAFTGKDATPPKEVSTSQSLKGVVASSPGAIGFVKAEDFHVDGSDGGVKAVKVDGIAASEAGYKLRM